MKNNFLLLLLLLLFLIIVAGCSSNEKSVENNNLTSDVNEKEIEYEKGLVENGVYTNSLLNIRFTPTENMVISTEEEMLANYENGAELIKNGSESLKNIDFSSFDIINELAATDVTTGSNIQIIAEKVSLSNLTPKQYISATFAQYNNIEGFELTNQTEIEDYELCGVVYSKSTATINYSDIELNQTYLCTNSADRIVCIIITSMSESDTNTFLDCFSPIK